MAKFIGILLLYLQLRRLLLDVSSVLLPALGVLPLSRHRTWHDITIRYLAEL